MNYGAHSPDTVLQDHKPLSLRDIRDLLDMLQEFICDNAYHSGIERDGELITGGELVERCRDAESALYIFERASK